LLRYDWDFDFLFSPRDNFGNGLFLSRGCSGNQFSFF